MSVFVHDKTGKCLSLTDMGFTCNGKSVSLENCDNHLPNLRVANNMDSLSSKYQIKQKLSMRSPYQCVLPDENNALHIGSCNSDDSIFTLYETDKDTAAYVDLEQIRIDLIYNDNVSAHVKNESVTWCKKLFNLAHKQTFTQMNSYFVIYDVDFSKTEKSQIFNKNGKIFCKLKLIVEEYDKDPTDIQKLTEYYLVPNENESLLIFSTTDVQTPSIILEKFNIRNNSKYNVVNFNQCRIGYVDKNGNINFGTLDLEKSKIGMILSKSLPPTMFRIAFLDLPDKFKLLYKPFNSNDKRTKLSSFQNPVKKVITQKDGYLTSTNLSNRSRFLNSHYIISPIQNSNSRVEGFSPNSNIQNTFQGTQSATTAIQDVKNAETIFKNAITELNILFSQKESLDFNQVKSRLDSIKKNLSVVNFSNTDYHNKNVQSVFQSLKSIVSNIGTVYPQLNRLYIGYDNALDLNKTKKVSIPSINLKDIENSMNNIKAQRNAIKQDQRIRMYTENMNIDFFIDTQKIGIIDTVVRGLNSSHDLYQQTLYKTNYLYTNETNDSNLRFLNRENRILRNRIIPNTVLFEVKRNLEEYSTKLKSNDFTKNTTLFSLSFSTIAENASKQIENLLVSVRQEIKYIDMVNRFVKITNTIQQKEKELFSNLNDKSLYRSLIMKLYECHFLPIYSNMGFEAKRMMADTQYLNTINLYHGIVVNDRVNYEETSIEFARLFKEMFEQISMSSVDNIPKADTKSSYYTETYFLVYCNKVLKSRFLYFASSYYKQAIVMLSNSDEFSKSINTKSTFTSASTAEGFEGNIKSSDNSFHPNEPQLLNVCRGELVNVANKNQGILNAFKYRDRGDETYKSFNDYVTDEYTSYTLRSDNTAQCQDTENNNVSPTINLDYSSMNGNSNTLTSNVYNSICSVSSSTTNPCNLDVTMSLKYERNNGNRSSYRIFILIENNISDSGSPKSAELNLDENFNIALEDLQLFYDRENTEDNSNKKQSFQVKSEQGIIELLTQIPDEGNVDDLNIGQQYALYSSDLPYFRIVIDTNNRKKLMIQYIPKAFYELNEDDLNMQYGKTNRNTNVYVNKLNNNDNNLYKVGNSILHDFGYVDLQNRLSTNVQRASHDISFVEMNDYTMRNATEITGFDGLQSALAHCGTDNNCLGIVSKDNNSKMYELNANTIENLYHNPNLQNNEHSTLYYKKFGATIIDEMNKSYQIPGSGKNTLIPKKRYTKYINSSMTKQPKLNLIGILMQEEEDRLRSSREIMNRSFEEMVNKFEALNNEEIKILQETGVNIQNLRNIVDEYDKLHNLKNKGKRLSNMYKTQNKEMSGSNGLYTKTQYAMAASGIFSIGALLLLMSQTK